MRPDEAFGQLGLQWRSACPELTPPILANEMKMLEWRCFALNTTKLEAKKCTLFLSKT